MEKNNVVLAGGEIVEFPFDLDQLNKILECPICNDVPLPPIFNCSSGHSICGLCRPKLKRCGLCESDFTESRNFVMENLIGICKFHCPFKEHGCSQQILGDSLEHHIAICLYRNGPLNDKDKQNKNASFLRCIYWAPIKLTDPIPPDSFYGGVENGNKLFVVRKLLPNKALVPGVYNTVNNNATFIWGNKIFVTKTFEILTIHPDTVDWIKLEDGDNIPNNAVIGGKSDIGEALYIVRKRQGKLCIGYIQGGYKKCTLLVNNVLIESTLPPFEVLVKNANGILLENHTNY